MHPYQFARIAAGSIWFRLAMVSSALVLGGPCLFAGAGTPPLLEFDVPFVIGCRGLPIKDPAQADPEKELIEVVIPISARLQAGTEKDLKQCLYTLVAPAEPEILQVTDWLPRTELKTEFAKPIQFSNERLAKIGINLSAHYVVSAAGDASGQLKSGVNYEMLPPQEIVLASGSIQHGRGVFFKLKPSTQTTLEGIKSFSAIFAVPRGWRGGYLKLECEAVGIDRGAISKLDRDVSSGQAVLYLALYRSDDAEAEQLADRVARCERELFDSLAQHRHEARAACHQFFSWPGLLGKWPWFLDKSTAPGDDRPTPAEVALLNYVLDRATTQARPTSEFPAPVLAKLRALQEAAAAIAVLSFGRPPAHDQAGAWQGRAAALLSPTPVVASSTSTARQTTPIASATRVAMDFVPPDISHRQPVASKTESRKQSAPHSGAGQEKASVPAAAAPREAPADKGKEDKAKTSAAPIVPPRVSGGTEPASSAGDGPPRGAGLGFLRQEASITSQLPQDPPKPAWYLLASMWGALFTYVVAPLVVDVIRMHVKDRHGRRARNRQALKAQAP